MLRHSARETPIHLITDEQAYKDVRPSVMGGLSCIFQPFAQANNPKLGEEDYNPKEPVLGLQRHVPGRNDAAHALTVALPEENAASTKRASRA